MIAYPYGAIYVGVALIIAGILTMTRHFLLEPMFSRYPKAPALVRHSMFLFATALLFIGLQYIWVFVSGKPDTVPPQPTANMQFLATTLVIYKAVMLVNIIRQRYPEEVWTKLNRLNDSLPCKDRKILTWLSK